LRCDEVQAIPFGRTTVADMGKIGALPAGSEEGRSSGEGFAQRGGRTPELHVDRGAWPDILRVAVYAAFGNVDFSTPQHLVRLQLI